MRAPARHPVSFPSLTGANPSCLAKSATGAIASSSWLDRKTTRWPPSTTGSVASFGRTQVIEALHQLGAGEHLRDEGGGQEAAQLFGGTQTRPSRR